MAAVVLNHVFHEIWRGSGLPVRPIRPCGGALSIAQISAPLRIALKIAVMLVFPGNGETLGILVQFQVNWLLDCMQSKLTTGMVQPA